MEKDTKIYCIMEKDENMKWGYTHIWGGYKARGISKDRCIVR